VLKPVALPAPMHGLPGILKAKCFSLADKLSIIGALTSVMFSRHGDPLRRLSDWLKAHRQSKGAMHRFWHLVIASALNSELDHISLPYATKVIRELFLNSAYAGSMGMSRVPLSELYGGAQPYVESRGGSIVFNTNIESADWNDATGSWTLRSSTDAFTAQNLILALPFEATAKLLPRLPSNPAATQLAEHMKKLEHWPICSVHLWFDREITELDHAVLLDRDIHWMYHKSRWQPSRDRNASYIELVISVSREFAALTREQALNRAITQLTEFFPSVSKATIVKSALIKEVRATFGVQPGVDALRPTADSPWPNCFLAGDWTATGWPSTMESAARSGHLAAEALCLNLGEPRGFLLPDLQPKGLMQFLSQD